MPLKLFRDDLNDIFQTFLDFEFGHACCLRVNSRIQNQTKSYVNRM